MPMYDYRCKDCGEVFESIEVWKSHAAKECKKCQSPNIERCIGTPHIRMDSDPVLHSIPDPTPPLDELRGKGTHGYKDKPHVDIKNYTRRKDKYGNSIWEEKHKQYFDQGRK